jgi:anti-sigma B factor antagonist
MQPPKQLVIETDVGADGLRLALVGELDLSTAAELEAAIAEVCAADGASQITLDLDGLSFVDSAGLRAILGAGATCTRHGCDFQLTHGQEPVERLFELTGLAQKLPFETPERSADERTHSLLESARPSSASHL